MLDFDLIQYVRPEAISLATKVVVVDYHNGDFQPVQLNPANMQFPMAIALLVPSYLCG